MSPVAAETFDIAIVGGGIVGASIAHFASEHARVLLLEAEAQPGSHATGRSAALYTASYGPPIVRALTRASRVFFDRPPAGFASVPLLHARGSLFVAREDQRDEIEALHAKLSAEGIETRLLDTAQTLDLVPVLKAEAAAVGLAEAGAFDIDVDALLQGYLRGAKSRGATVATSARLARIERDGATWRLATDDGRRFAATTVVNAAGAWADEVATLAGAARVGIEPRRRSAFTFAPPDGVDPSRWPAVVSIDESWYFKPDAGLLLGSPANVDPAHPHDVVPEELDIALGIHRIEEATTLTIRRPKSTWAGLRSFVADGEPVCGFDPTLPGFFWAAALGGYGIQSSPGFGRLCATLLARRGLPSDIEAEGLRTDALDPARCTSNPPIR